MVPTHCIFTSNYSQRNKGFGTAKFSLIFKLNRQFSGEKSQLVLYVENSSNEFRPEPVEGRKQAPVILPAP